MAEAKDMRVTFNEVSLSGTKRWVDENGKKRQKTRKFWQTISPFNIAADGSLKSREQILSEVKAQRDAWLSDEATQ